MRGLAPFIAADGSALWPNLTRQLETLPDRLSEHVLVSLVALALAAAVSLPLGMAATRIKALRWPSLMVASLVQTVPALALLVLIFVAIQGLNAVGRWLFGMPPDAALLRGIGFIPAVTALTLYAILPMLRNTVTGLRSIDPAVIEAAYGVGMYSRQVLMRIELPLAAPVILAGVRTAAVWTVGMATLSTLVGQTSLGDYIFDGLQNQNWVAVIVGCVFAALFAIVVDQALGLIERGVARRRSRPVKAGGAVLGGVMVIAILPWLVSVFDERQAGPTVHVGAKPFNESYILAELIADQLDDHYNVVQKKGLGTAVAFKALRSGEIDAYVDYTGTIWATVMKREATADRDKLMRQMTQWLRKEKGVYCLGSLGFENSYALAVRRSFARRRRLDTIEDLTTVTSELTIASDPEFFGRSEWRDLKQAYSLEFRDRLRMQSTLLYKAAGRGEVDVITGYTSDPRINQYNLKVLTDNRRVLPPYDAVLLVSEALYENKDAIRRLRPLIGGIDTELMREANRMVDLESQPPATAARWLRDKLEIAQ